jgi:hypothetical protein
MAFVEHEGTLTQLTNKFTVPAAWPTLRHAPARTREQAAETATAVDRRKPILADFMMLTISTVGLVIESMISIW